MKQPRHGILSTTPKVTARQSSIHVTAITVPLQPTASIQDSLEEVSGQVSEQVSEYNSQWPNLIRDDGDKFIANVFVFGAFADKNSGIVYHDLTGSFPFMLLDGSICFFVLYHYELNCILASPIAGWMTRLSLLRMKRGSRSWSQQELSQNLTLWIIKQRNT